MQIFIDPFWATIFVAGGIFIVSFLLGRASATVDKRQMIDDLTEMIIKHLCDEGFIRWKRRPDGEIELYKYDSAD
jgi:hypothetical protein